MPRETLRRRHFLRIALIGSAGSLLAACAPASPSASPTAAPTQAAAKAESKPAEPAAQAAPAAKTDAKPGSASGKPLTVGFHQEPQNLDPFSTTTAAFQSVTAATIEQLVYFAPNDPQIRPGLATSWKWLDPTTLELKLRENVKFSNGEEFDAQAAAFSLKLLMEAKAYSNWTSDFAAAEPTDKSTVHLKMKQPSGIAVGALARGSYVYPPKYYQESGAEKFGTAPVGTGPYKFVDWQKGSRIVFEPHPTYWGGTPQLGATTWRIIPEESARVAALQAGEVQLITNLSQGAVSRIKSDNKLDVISLKGGRMFAAFFDETIDHPIQNKLVRQALNYAVDKQGLVRLYGGEAAPLEGQYLMSNVPGFNPNVKMFPYDPARAKELLAQAGHPNGFETTFAYTIDRYPLDKELGQAVAGYLEAVGIKVNQQALEYGKFRDNFRAGMGQAGPLFQWALLFPPDPIMVLQNWKKGSDYRRFPDDPEIDGLLASIEREPDEQKRTDMVQRLMAIWHDSPFGIYLIVPNDIYGRTKGLAWEARFDQVVDLSEASLEG